MICVECGLCVLWKAPIHVNHFRFIVIFNVKQAYKCIVFFEVHKVTVFSDLYCYCQHIRQVFACKMLLWTECIAYCLFDITKSLKCKVRHANIICETYGTYVDGMCGLCVV